MTKPVDILLATFNGEMYLDELLSSIASQTYTNWHLIIHDDGSTDNTCQIINSFQSTHPDKVNIINDNVITGSAKNNFSHLITHSNADYVMFCDQDDVWLPNKIEIFIDNLLKQEELHPESPILIHSDLVVVDQNLNKVAESFWKYQGLDESKNSFNRLIIQNSITGCATMVNRKLLDLAGTIPEGAIMHDWWLALIAAKFGKIFTIKQRTVLYRQHGSNTVGAKNFTISGLIRQTFQSDFSGKLNSIKESIRSVKSQAKTFYELYKSELSPDIKNTLLQFVNLDELNPIRKRLFLIKNGYLKHGFTRNIVFLVVI